MGTKSNPGKFDCYAKAEPDEPIFTLLGRDPDAAEVVAYWAHLRRRRLNRENFVSEEGFAAEAEKITEAEDCAGAMRAYWEARANGVGASPAE